RNSVDDFLFGTQEGYCEHFASAFAVMMRDAGIPTRVVTGYQGGQYNQVGDYWLIRNSDAHAWTEVWLEGRGWVRIDPTASVAPERIREGLAGLIPPPGAFSRWGQPLWDSLDSMRRAWNYLIVDFDAATQRALFQRLGLDPQDWRQVAIALGIGIVLALGLSFALLWRGGRKRISDPLQAAWARFCRRLGGAGLIKQADETASALLERCDALPAADAKAARTLIQRYVSQRYAEAQTTTAQRQSLIGDLRRFRISTRVARRAP
ncbi:MAG: transglutaminase domain-containing protein, partial [Xanthomonadales bacterium]|nr:transglutaminase domain-containing protein [Xanthomonadales bacterium]